MEFNSGASYNLSELNLVHWRANNVAFCSHETLEESGSTGQKQLANIQKVLTTKKEAQIFIFDEADNALDQEKQQEFMRNLEKLVKKGKIVIYVKH